MKKSLVDSRYRSHLRITHSTDFLEADEGHGCHFTRLQHNVKKWVVTRDITRSLTESQYAGYNMNEISINLALQEMNTMLANLREPKRFS